jgi:hypothetical protein
MRLHDPLHEVVAPVSHLQTDATIQHLQDSLSGFSMFFPLWLGVTSLFSSKLQTGCLTGRNRNA